MCFFNNFTPLPAPSRPHCTARLPSSITSFSSASVPPGSFGCLSVSFCSRCHHSFLLLVSVALSPSWYTTIFSHRHRQFPYSAIVVQSHLPSCNLLTALQCYDPLIVAPRWTRQLCHWLPGT